jgi:hypothetical protein
MDREPGSFDWGFGGAVPPKPEQPRESEQPVAQADNASPPPAATPTVPWPTPAPADPNAPQPPLWPGQQAPTQPPLPVVPPQQPTYQPPYQAPAQPSYQQSTQPYDPNAPLWPGQIAPAQQPAQQRMPVQDDPFASLQRAPREERPAWDNPVSFDPTDLGFEAQDIPRRSFARRMVGPVIFLVIFGGLIVGGTVAADKLARDAVEGVIAGKVAETFGLASDNAVTVDLGPGIFIGQAISGTIDQVSVDVPGATFGELKGTLALDAQGVPTSPSQPSEQVGVQLAMTGDDAIAFATSLQGQEGATVTLGDGVLNVTSSKNKIEFAVSFAPSVDAGTLVLTPQAITVRGETMTPEEFSASKYGKVGASLIEPKSVCVAASLPAALSLTGLTVSESSLVVAGSGANVPLVGGGLTTRGTCEEE